MTSNHATIKDTYTTRNLIKAAVRQVQVKEVMATQTPERYLLKSMMSRFLLAIVTVFMLAIKTQFTGTNDGLINLLGTISFSLALVLIVLTNSELLTSNFIYLTVGWHYKVTVVKKILYILLFCFIGNIIGGFILFLLMKGTHMIIPEMVASLNKTVHLKTVESAWLSILIKEIFCNSFINIDTYVSMFFKGGLARAFFIAVDVIVFVFMGYKHVVFNTGLHVGMIFYNSDVLSWIDVLKDIVFTFVGNYIGGGILVGLIYACLNGKRDSIKA